MTHQTKSPAVNYIKHIDIFFDIVKVSPAINYAHIALYISLFRFWNHSFFSNPISPSRSEIMVYAGIKSKECYYRLLRELSELDLIRYYPSKSRYETGLFCISKLEFIDGNIKITVLAISNHESLTGKQSEISYPDNKQTATSFLSSGTHKSQLINGRGSLLIEKTICLSTEDGQSTILSTIPVLASTLPTQSTLSSKNTSYANYQNPKSRNSNLRPSGVQVDSKPNYTEPL